MYSSLQPKVGGILANNTYPADFIRDNLIIQTNIIEAAADNQRRPAALPRLLLHLPQTGPAAHAGVSTSSPARSNPRTAPTPLAKIAGIEMCWSYNRQYGTKYLAAMPTNLYGPNDNFDLEHTPMSFPRSSARPPKPSQGVQTRSPSGAPARPAANCSTPTT